MIDDKGRKYAATDPALISATLSRTRKELEIHSSDLSGMSHDLQQASAEEDPVHLTLLELKGILNALSTLKIQADAAHLQLIRYETDEDNTKTDAAARKKFQRLWNKSYAEASSLKTIQEVQQQMSCVSRAVKP